MKVVIRGWGDGQLIFKDTMDTEAADVDPAALAALHGQKLERYEKHMIEFEWCDELDPMQRYTRFGTDASMMVQPLAVNDPTKAN